MDRNELAERTKRFYINVIKICSLLPKNVAAYEIAKQLNKVGRFCWRKLQSNEKSEIHCGFYL